MFYVLFYMQLRFEKKKQIVGNFLLSYPPTWPNTPGQTAAYGIRPTLHLPRFAMDLLYNMVHKRCTTNPYQIEGQQQIHNKWK